MSTRGSWAWAACVFVAVLIAQLALVAVAGTDIPFQDQWDIEGRWLYPKWCEGSFQTGDLLHSFNENRIAWTLALDLALFKVNGQWDPLVQLAVNASLRALCAAGLAWLVARGGGARGRGVVAAAVVLAFLPHLAWHNALWAIESHAYFAVGFTLLTFALLEPARRSRRRTIAGLVAGACALLAMSPAAMAPVALLGLAGLRALEERNWRPLWPEAWPAASLLVLAFALRSHEPALDSLRAQSCSQFLLAAGRLLGWPHAGQPLAAVPLNLALLAVVVGRALRWRRARPGEDFVVLAGGWAVAIALGAAWKRGGSAEMWFGVPSRYVDFLVLLPLMNAWCLVALARDLAETRWRGAVRLIATAWVSFLLIGWIGLSAEVMRRIVLPRARDREAPVRLLQTYQASGDTNVFAGQPRLLVPHPNLAAVDAVLADARMRGRLPPSLQPGQPIGPLSRGVRALLGRQ